ncbi:spermatogenesis associated 6-like protein isoform X2 [Girardinichthys multiradiatus]|uniref:spermatogenesis associated 6-like protein isoform X2 n=1 Tax=Girardinichthys multiradiatus TaxID=208333 RepID=UPI001FAD43AC|nr:spermatogenesis associated 6-like protein isoform X2 [Girardinichthys multiradiatus]
MSRKALKVLAEIKIRAVSCPGVHLSAKDDIYLRMDFMGQFHQSECLPAVFPLLFHEKMTFEKIFRHAVDPGDIAVLLKYEAVRIELVQLIPPDHVHFVAGDTLACFEEDARSFLFPEPKLVPPFSGVGREVLMRTAAHFPGIAPRLEFSTRTTITECPPDTEVTICPKTPIRPAIRRKLRRSSIPRSTPPQTAWGRESVRMDRERPRTVKPLLYIPRSQSMSPGRENIQNLAQLSIDSAPPLTSDWETRSQPVRGTSEYDSSYLEAHDPSDCHDGPVPSALQPSYRELARHSSSHRTLEELHEHVRGLLSTPKALRRLVYGATVSEVDEVLARRSISPGPP